jgi:hypothetical protein
VELVWGAAAFGSWEPFDLRGVKLLGYMYRAHRRWPGLWWTLLAILVYTLVAVIVTYPLIFNLSSRLAGTGDSYEYNWVLWRIKQIVSGSGGGLAYLPWLNYPVGLYHPFMLTMLTVDLTALPFLLIFPSHVVYNLLILSGLVLCGLSAYWFTSELTGDRRAGFIGGLVFGFFSNKMGHVAAAHLPQTLAYWVPLFALLLWRVVWKPGWRRGLMCGLVLVPTLLVHPIHVAYFVLPVTLAILFYALVQLRRRFFERRRLWVLMLAFGVAAIVVVPIWWPSISAEWDEGYLRAGGTVSNSTDLLAFFTPSPYHPILASTGWLPGYAREVFPDEHALNEGSAYPGLLVLALGILALVKRWRRTWIWGALAVACLVLALGPVLKVGGRVVVYTVDEYQTDVLLPYALVKSLPLFGVSRTPGRINETAFFALAVLAAFGFGALPRRPARQWVLSALAIVLAIGIVFETLVRWPLPLCKLEVPQVVRTIAAEDGTGALLHVPAFTDAKSKNLALYYQTVHGRPIVGGWTHRSLPEAGPWVTMFSELVKADRADRDIVPRPDLAERRAWLRYFDIDYIVLDKTRVTSRGMAKYEPLIEGSLGPVLAEDETLVAFSVPADTPAPESSLLYTFAQHGWHELERDGESWRRWMYDGGLLYVYSTAEEMGSLRFTVDSHLAFPVLEVYLEKQLVDAFVVGERTTYTTRPFILKQGMNTFHFHAPGGCPDMLNDPRCWQDALLEPPTDNVVPPCDMPVTCRTFVFDRISFVSQGDLPASMALDVDFGDQIRLRGWELEETAVHPGGTLTVTMAWEPMVELSDRHVVFLHLISPDGSLVAQRDSAPVGEYIPVSGWPPGVVFNYPMTLELPDGLPPGRYRLLGGVYLWPSLERLNLPGIPDNVLELTQVEVVP